MISGEARDIGVDEKLVISAAALKDLRETAEDRMYWKGRAEGIEYAVDALRHVLNLYPKGGK